ncbi:hypothetical protein N8I77_004345 [Diaporthe amygdali]|uniref:Uncharacterized protein n=1 Tax=Phomopsis amygdali TaxID=1214568 RepID=A0AAD9W6W7_PHOAM|nr:hypothetical protein N8I77_004345 [Diaporthe amygdali]
MAGFAKLTPAFTAKIPIDPPNAIGVLSTGNHLTHVSFVADQEALASEPGYPTALKGTWVHGSDYIKTDADGKYSRLEVDSLVKDTRTGGLVRYRYTGVVDMAGAAGKVLRGDADAATTDFGEIYTHVKFETGHAELKDLENKVFVGSGRFILEAGKPVTVEYKISQVSI